MPSHGSGAAAQAGAPRAGGAADSCGRGCERASDQGHGSGVAIRHRWHHRAMGATLPLPIVRTVPSTASASRRSRARRPRRPRCRLGALARTHRHRHARAQGHAPGLRAAPASGMAGFAPSAGLSSSFWVYVGEGLTRGRARRRPAPGSPGSKGPGTPPCSRLRRLRADMVARGARCQATAHPAHRRQPRQPRQRRTRRSRRDPGTDRRRCARRSGRSSGEHTCRSTRPTRRPIGSNGAGAGTGSRSPSFAGQQRRGRCRGAHCATHARASSPGRQHRPRRWRRARASGTRPAVAGAAVAGARDRRGQLTLTAEAGCILQNVQAARRRSGCSSAQPGRRRQLHHRREPRHQCRRHAVLRSAMHATVPRARGGDGSGTHLARALGRCARTTRLRTCATC